MKEEEEEEDEKRGSLFAKYKKGELKGKCFIDTIFVCFSFDKD